MFFTPEVVARLEAVGEVLWTDGRARLTAEELEARMYRSNVWVFGRGDFQIRLTREIIASAPVKLIGYTGGSLKKLLAADAFDAGIPIVCGNDAFAAPLAEMTLLLMILSLRRLCEVVIPMKTEENYWPSEKAYTGTLFGKTVGILGFGMIAEALLPLLEPFGTRILVNDPYLDPERARRHGLEPVDIETLFRDSGVVTIHHTLTPETYHLVTRDLLRLMPDGAVLVNTSRGKIVDQDDLVEELTTGRIMAGLDVYETEPLPTGHPFRRLPNVVTTPHCGGATMKCYREQVSYVVDDVQAFAEGRPLQHEVSGVRFRRMSEHLKRGAGAKLGS
jgi:phosphoglycerate dehydrogenase-like enzyme